MTSGTDPKKQDSNEKIASGAMTNFRGSGLQMRIRLKGTNRYYYDDGSFVLLHDSTIFRNLESARNVYDILRRIIPGKIEIILK